MKKEQLQTILDGLDDRFLAEAAACGEPSASARRLPRAGRTISRLKTAAACLLLAAVMVLAAAGAEAAEYAAAHTFFEENGLATDGLSRADIREVYRDITTRTFGSDKTAAVLTRAVPGLALAQEAPSPEVLASLWDQRVFARTPAGAGYAYSMRCTEKKDPSTGVEVTDTSTVECRLDGHLLWTAAFPDVFTEGAVHAGDATFVWGQVPQIGSDYGHSAWLACVDDAGQTRWSRVLLHGYGQESIAAVLEKEEGAVAVISRGNLRFLTLTLFDASGRQTYWHQTEIGNLGVWGAARLGDGYLVHVGTWQQKETATLLKLDADGVPQETLSYEADDGDYYLTDMASFGGRIFLSAWFVPKTDRTGSRADIQPVLDQVFSEDRLDIPDEELTLLVRDNYTAVLLVCDEDGGLPQTFYSAEGSLGGRLAVAGDGTLLWDVENISSTFLSLATNSFTVGGVSTVYRYAFDASGTLLSRTKTGETVPFRR